MEKVVSKDGTAIAFDRVGEGPPVILVDGAFGNRAFGPNGPLVPFLSPHFTVYTYDRRGRGDSGDTLPYEVDREIEDLDAIIQEAGGAAHVHGISSGAALALEAANRGLAIPKLTLYEAPFVVDDTRAPIPADYLDQLKSHVAADRRGDAVKLFMSKGVGLPGIVVMMMRFMPAWSKLKSIAHTVVYDATILGDTGFGKPLSSTRWDSVSAQTLVIVGSKSPQWMRNAMGQAAEVIPNAKHRTLDGETHIVKPKALAPVLIDFLQD